MMPAMMAKCIDAKFEEFIDRGSRTDLPDSVNSRIPVFPLLVTHLFPRPPIGVCKPESRYGPWNSDMARILQHGG